MNEKNDSRIVMIKEFLENTHSKFSNMNFRCEYNPISSTYIIEVKPLHEFEENDDYATLEYNFTSAFEKKFPQYLLTFVSDNSMTKVENPDFEICTFENKTSNLVNFTDVNIDDTWYMENNSYMTAA